MDWKTTIFHWLSIKWPKAASQRTNEEINRSVIDNYGHLCPGYTSTVVRTVAQLIKNIYPNICFQAENILEIGSGDDDL